MQYRSPMMAESAETASLCQRQLTITAHSLIVKLHIAQKEDIRPLTLCPLSDISPNRRTRVYSVREAAAKLGVTDRHVRLLLARGQLSGRRLGHDWAVLSLDYERKRKPKTMKGPTVDGGETQKWEETWTEGGL